ncbi:MAG: class I tRNA ligase family protein, partial [Ignavibacteria bacterium]|nr:class I tRNA ligase family protein [Ignavibacteria bacterium]
IAKYDGELNHFRFNTAIASLMELINELKTLSACGKEIQVYTLERLAILLAAIAPHLAEECWRIIGKEKTIFENPVWFDADKDALTEDVANIAVQISGKLRATIQVPMNSDEAAVKAVALTDERVARWIEGKTVVKEIFVKNKIFNIVLK